MDYLKRFLYFKSPSCFYVTILLLVVQPPYLNAIFTPENCKALSATTHCQCSQQPTHFELECASSRSSGKFNIHISPGKLIKVECDDIKANEYEILPSMELGISNIVKILNCPLPEAKQIAQLLTRWGIPTVDFLIYENDEHSTNITNHHLSGMEKLQHFKLSTKSLKDSPDNLFRNLTNLIWLELHSKNSTLSKRLLEPLPDLIYLDLGNNFLQHLPGGVFKNQHKLKRLNLWNNRLRNLDKEVFRGMNALTELDLNSNGIESLEHDVFSLLGNMKSLDLNMNRFHELPVGLFARNKYLNKFSLVNNKIPLKSLPSGLLSNLPFLVEVHLTCGLEAVPMDLLANSKKLSDLAMTKNLLTTLPENFLNDQHKLISLDLSHNRLQSLPDTLFQSTKNLVVLKLSHNQLAEIPGELFNPLANLEHVQLHNNNLVSISFNAFRDTANLKFLNLENNQIDLANTDGLIDNTSSPFRNLSKLQEMNLRNNNIRYLHEDWKTQLHNLRKLDLSYNNIHAFADHDLRFISKNAIEVNITHNRIEKIDFNTGSNKSINLFNDAHPILIDLNNNPLHCDCKLSHFLEFIFGEFKKDKKLNQIEIVTNKLRCAGPPALRGRKVVDLSYMELICPLDDQFTQIKLCPNDCECLVRPFDQMLFINCSHNNMTHLPKLPHLPKLRGIELNVEHNRLTSLPLNTTPGYADVLALHVAENQLQNIEVSNLPKKLEYLDVRHNQLQRLNASFVDFLNSSTNLQAVFLAHNPWICDCEAIPLVEFIRYVREKFTEQDMRHMSCIVESSNTKISVTLTDVSINELCPSQSIWFVIIAVTIAIILAALMIDICAAIYRKYKRGALPNSNIKYDAYVSYAQRDEHYIIEQLIPELENSPNPSEVKFKLCLHKRDWNIGESFTQQVKRSVRESHRSIVVLSNNFVREWLDQEFRMAHMSALSAMSSRLIVIVYSDIESIESLDKNLRVSLAANTYIKWGDPLFWNYLRAALPEKSCKPELQITVC